MGVYFVKGLAVIKYFFSPGFSGRNSCKICTIKLAKILPAEKNC